MIHRFSRTFTHQIGETVFTLRQWGPADGVPVFMLHGSLDSSVTFQFLVDALPENWCITAPDQYGYGDTGPSSAHFIWHHEMVADAYLLMRDLYQDRPVIVVGHSLGGNIAMVLAAARPAVISHLISLDAFGLLDDRAVHAPEVSLDQYLIWRENGAHQTVRSFASVDEMAARLRDVNPRLTVERADFLARHQALLQTDGTYRWKHFPRVPRSAHHFRNDAEWAWMLQSIQCPVLWIASDEQPGRFGNQVELERRYKDIRRGEFHKIKGSSHNLHHEEEEAIAALMIRFVQTADKGL